MSNVSVEIGKLTLTTYKEIPAEEMPMFSENRVHQRTSGRPYPNHIVLDVDRKHKEDKDYVCITLENKYIKLEILPELGGRIYSALDKTTGYDFFYKQHVIKSALIGVLGSWISGGLEFNWPFHHRPSTYMPTDYYIEHEKDGGVIVWLSEHDPIERMKGMVGICLKPDSAIFETRMQLCNRTPVKSSFLWWENAAVPVNKQYQIFYPQDVSYVRFHYKRSVTTFPVASNATGVFNGIRYNGNIDISMHKNTIQPTSYFCADSKYDFFGGYDHGKECGVVHVANHHTAPGKKMFTWAYNMLSKSWEKALTDTDGAYAELMAGSYSDNQPDFAWIEPYETKNFSQFWYPIGKLGIPVFANLNCAVTWEDDKLIVQPTRDFASAKLVVENENSVLFEKQADLFAGKPTTFNFEGKATGNTVKVIAKSGVVLAEYTIEVKDVFNIPRTTEDMPNHKKVKTAQELYMEGMHVWQYRDPAILPDAYWKEALQRDPEFIPALLSLADFYYKRTEYETAMSYAERAIAALTKYNKRTPTGEAYYKLALILDKMGKIDDAYDYFNKASWNMDSYSAAMTHIAGIDGKRGNYDLMAENSMRALRYNTQNPIASVYGVVADYKRGLTADAVEKTENILKADHLNHFARYMLVLLGKMSKEEFYSELHSDASQTCMDIAFNMIDGGMNEEAKTLLTELEKYTGYASPMVYYVTGDYKKAKATPLNSLFPSRPEEKDALLSAVKADDKDAKAWYYLGCLEYDKNEYTDAEKAFKKSIAADPSFYIPYRNLAALYYSRLNRKDEVLGLLNKALELSPANQQLVYEIVYVMGKLGTAPSERLKFLEANAAKETRDDLLLEWARAYTLSDEPEKALELICNHAFVPCEGGEHAVAEQYMFAHHLIGRKLMKKGDFANALKEFDAAIALPESLGAGIWNECRYVPHQYQKALCLVELGKNDEAVEIYNHILSLTIDYFSNMHLRELPYYQALCYRNMGEVLKGNILINNYIREWKEALPVEDPGFFGTTPFFISYCDNPKDARTAYYKYLIGLAEKYIGDMESAHKDLEECVQKDKINLIYMIEKNFD